MEISTKEQQDALFQDVAFIVEADNTTKHLLWYMHYHNPEGTSKIKTWRDDTSGFIICIGYCAERPVCVSVFYAFLNDKRVMFYSDSSAIVDHNLIDDWVRTNAKGIGICDAMNFAHCLNAISS